MRRAIQSLEELEELEVVHHGGINYGQIRPTNRYFIRLNCPENCDSTLSHSYPQPVYKLSTETGDRTFKVTKEDI